MRQGTCCECGLTTTIRSFYSFTGKTYCEPCLWKASQQASEKGEPSEYISLLDNSVCARCGSSSGDTEDYPTIGRLPLCPTCASQVTNWPYPTWLKASLAVLLALLAVALVHGRRYFHAGRSMYQGERLVEQQKYEAAIPYLREALQVAPGSDKAALLEAKAALKVGDVEEAQKTLKGHNGGHFEDEQDPRFLEVRGLWERALQAVDKAERASKLAEQPGQSAEAARLMHEAASVYPEASGLAISADLLDEGAAFERKDYDAFVAVTQKEWKERPGPDTAASLASALACKYATTGNVGYRQQSEEMLRKADQMTQGNIQAMKSFEEYAERIHYRLVSREIIDKPEYDRRFRQTSQRK